MADNSTLPGTGDVYGSDDISGVKFQRIKLVHGIDGINDGDIAATNPLPVLGDDVVAAIVRLVEVMERVQIQLSMITDLQLDKGDL